MASKRPASPTLIPNPFIKKRNLHWTLEPPNRDNHDHQHHHQDGDSQHGDDQNTPAASTPPSALKPLSDNIPSSAIEAGRAHIADHLAHFTHHLSARISPPTLLPLSSYASLYQSNVGHSSGAHFVIHQHDHPIAGTHYDLRLQINETSSVSWAIMYGLPGDPNSVRLNRNATETRIHCLWVSSP